MDNIAKQNDVFRTTMIPSPRHRVVFTPSVAESPDREEIITKVREFKDFTSWNDPYDEHDFGSFTVNGTKYFWKIDYYDETWEYGKDPSEGCARLLTVMRADEY